MSNEILVVPAPQVGEVFYKKSDKPGYKTTEFWLTFGATAIQALQASGVLSNPHPAVQALSTLLTALSPLLYQYLRNQAKR